MAAAEQFALLSFRHESIQSGETEWIPYVSEAQALVNGQLERFSSLPPSSPAAATRALGGDVRSGCLPIPRKLAGSTSTPKPAINEMSVAGMNNDASATSGSGSSDMEGGGVVTAKSASIATAAGAAAGAVVTSEAGVFRFFQSWDGQKAFLHPLNMRQLLDDSEKGLPLPDRIDAKVR